MTSGGAGITPVHRSVTSIRLAPSQSQPGSPNPHTPRTPRTISASYGSPSAVRAEDDLVLIEIGSRFVRAGFSGDSLPKVSLALGPEQQRRAGDFGAGSARARAHDAYNQTLESWAAQRELWRHDLRDFDLGLFQDRLDRLLRDALTRFLLVDSRPRRMGLILDPALPIPLVSTALDILFHHFQTPVVSLISSPTMTAVAGGVRCALIIDMGWAETVVTSVYEFREVKTTRSVRAGRLLLDGLHHQLQDLLRSRAQGNERTAAGILGFDECEDILCRLMWCRPAASKSSRRQSAQLDTVVEQDEYEAETAKSGEGSGSGDGSVADIALMSTKPPSTLQVPFAKFADVCDETYFDLAASPPTFDDHELPLHLLVYHHLVQLPMDVRAVCMSRLMMTGGCAETLGIKERIVDEVSNLVEKRGWTPVSGKAADQVREKARLRRDEGIRDANSSIPPVVMREPNEGDDNLDGDNNRLTPHLHGTDEAAAAAGDPAALQDPVEAKIMRNRPVQRQMQGHLRALHSLGAWAGASLASQLRMPALATIERDQWLQLGVHGASRPVDVDTKAQQRHSAGAGGLMRGGAGHGASSWTLGIWGGL